MKKERIFNIKELLESIMLGWRFIIVFMLVFALLANAYAYVKAYRSILSKEDNVVVENTTDFSQYTESLNEAQIKETEKTYSVYLSYMDSYERMTDYYQNSIKMQLDSSKVDLIRIIYNISNKNVAAFSEDLNAALTSEEMCKKIKDKLGWDDDESYIGELISVQNLSEKDDKIESSNSKAVVVNILSKDKESCEMIADILEEYINENKAQLEKDFGACKKISRVYCKTVNQILATSQQQIVTTMKEVMAASYNLQYLLDEQQKIYYSALLENGKGLTENSEEISSSEDTTVVENEDTSNLDAQDNSVNIPIVNLKYMILGLMAGLFLSCGYLVFKYSIDMKIYSKEDFNCYFQIPVLGVLSMGEEKKKFAQIIDQYIIKIFEGKKDNVSYNEKIQMLCEGIKVDVRKNKIRKLYISGTVEGKEIDEVKSHLKSMLTESDVTIICGESVDKSIESFKNLIDSEGVIFVEKTRKSMINEIEHEINVCQKYEIPIMGSILLQ